MPEAAGDGGPPAIGTLTAAFDLDPTGAEVVRAASRHVVRFPASGVRTVAAPGESVTSAAEAAAARAFAEVDVPAARVRAGPELVAGWTVTVWDEIPVDDEDAVADATILGRLAARLHAATVARGPGPFPPCSLIDGARAQQELAEDAGASAREELDLLREETVRAERIAVAASAMRRTGVHGDLHEGNVVMGRNGPVLVDLELAGWGLRAYDAAPTVASVRWYGRPATDLRDFDDAYGAALTEECSANGLDEVWRLWSVSWAVANRHRSDEAEEEALVRLETLRTGTAPRPWALH
jgi:fructosamine-3-kinase